MANKVMGEVAVEINGKPRVLDFTFQTYESIGRILDSGDFVSTLKRIGDDLANADGTKFNTIWVILAEALRENWPEVTADGLRAALRPRDLPRIMAALEDALAASMPDEEPQEQPAKGAAKGKGAKRTPPVAAAA